MQVTIPHKRNYYAITRPRPAQDRPCTKTAITVESCQLAVSRQESQIKFNAKDVQRTIAARFAIN